MISTFLHTQIPWNSFQFHEVVLPSRVQFSHLKHLFASILRQENAKGNGFPVIIFKSPLCQRAVRTAGQMPYGNSRRGVTLESATRAAWYSSQGPPEVHNSIISCISCVYWEWARGDKHTASMSCPDIRRTEWEGTVEIMHFNYVDT